jgi:hypothetical protein
LVFLIVLMIVSLAITLLISVVAIVTSTSNGTDWLLTVWNNLKRNRPHRPLSKNLEIPEDKN